MPFLMMFTKWNLSTVRWWSISVSYFPLVKAVNSFAEWILQLIIKPSRFHMLSQSRLSAYLIHLQYGWTIFCCQINQLPRLNYSSACLFTMALAAVVQDMAFSFFYQIYLLHLIQWFGYELFSTIKLDRNRPTIIEKNLREMRWTLFFKIKRTTFFCFQSSN